MVSRAQVGSIGVLFYKSRFLDEQPAESAAGETLRRGDAGLAYDDGGQVLRHRWRVSEQQPKAPISGHLGHHALVVTGAFLAEKENRTLLDRMPQNH